MTNLELAGVLRAIADVYEQNPNIPQLHSLNGSGCDHVFCHSKDEFAETVRAFGPGKKDADEDGLIFKPALAGEADLRIYGFKKNCCERIQVGTKLIPAHDEIVIPAAPEREEPIFEYRCAPFLEAPESEVAA